METRPYILVVINSAIYLINTKLDICAHIFNARAELKLEPITLIAFVKENQFVVAYNEHFMEFSEEGDKVNKRFIKKIKVPLFLIEQCLR